MTQDELQAEYDAIQAQQAAEAGEEPTDPFGEPIQADMPPMDRQDPYVPEPDLPPLDPRPGRLSQEEIDQIRK